MLASWSPTLALKHESARKKKSRRKQLDLVNVREDGFVRERKKKKWLVHEEETIKAAAEAVVLEHIEKTFKEAFIYFFP